VNYLEALDHPHVFGGHFAGPSWRPWRTVERAIFGLPLDRTERRLFRKIAGDRPPPTKPCSEVVIVAGRRSSKTRKGATVGTYLVTIGAELLGTRARLSPGERGLVLVLAVDRAQARVCLDYARAYFDQVPLLKRLVKRQDAEEIELTNSVSFVVAANDYRSIRGRTILACVFDEVAYWRSELSTRPDIETYRAVRPALAAMPGSLLMMISSPYRQAGLLWQKYRQHFGKPGRVLVIKAPTAVLNPTIDQRLIAEDLENDREAASAEWLAEFRKDLADFVDREVVEDLVDRGVRERAPVAGQRYSAFADPAGGSGGDSFTVAIAHRGPEDLVVLDAIRERRPPFQPSQVVEEYAALLQSYGIVSVEGDRYAGAWPSEQFAKHGVSYHPADFDKSSIYLNTLPLLNSARVRLLDNDRLVAQLCGLERRVRAGGRDLIDHPVGARDDVCNAACGALRRARPGRVLEGNIADLAVLGAPAVALGADTPWGERSSIFDLGPAQMMPWGRPRLRPQRGR
jgi:hypothetical protein